LAATAIQGNEELATQSLSKRIAFDQTFDLTDEGCMMSSSEERLDAVFVRHKAQFVETVDLSLREGLEGQVRQRRTTPKRERLVVPRGGRSGAAPYELPRLMRETFEPLNVELVWLERDPITGAVAEEKLMSLTATDVRLQDLPELEHVALESVSGRRRRSFAPDLLDQRVCRHGPPASQQQDCEHRRPAVTRDRRAALRPVPGGRTPSVRRL
jgi:hypothetical protein